MKRAEHGRHAELVDVHEAARITGLVPDTIYRLAREGKLRSYRVLRRSVRFARDDLLGLLRVQRQTALASAATAGSQAATRARGRHGSRAGELTEGLHTEIADRD